MVHHDTCPFCYNHAFPFDIRLLALTPVKLRAESACITDESSHKHYFTFVRQNFNNETKKAIGLLELY